MTGSEPRIALAATIFAFATIFLPAFAAAPAAAAGAPPFCVLRGSADGGLAPQVCEFSDYQVCLQAAADLHGNCVQNIDFHGESSNAMAPPRARHRRLR